MFFAQNPLFAFAIHKMYQTNSFRLPSAATSPNGGGPRKQRLLGKKLRRIFKAPSGEDETKTGSVLVPRLYPSPPMCGRRFGSAENGDNRVSYFTALKGA